MALLSVGGAAALATWVAAKAMKRNMKVPANSAMKAMNSFRTQFGAKPNRASRRSFGVRGRSGAEEVFFLKGSMLRILDPKPLLGSGCFGSEGTSLL